MCRQVVVLSVAVLLCSIVKETTAGTNTEKLCFKGSEAESTANITLACPESQVIIIEEALFGRNKWLLCVVAEGDCVDKTRLFQECENRNNCSRSFKTYSTKCGYASVMFISYSCLQVDPITVYTSSHATVPTTKKAEIYGGYHSQEGLKSSGLVRSESGSSLNENGLIAGCVVAGVVTVIFLVIAITMVVRRLLHKNNPDDDDDDAEAEPVESKKYTCCSCFSHIKNCLSYREEKHDFKVAKMTQDAAVLSHSDKRDSADHRLPVETTDNSLNSADSKGQVISDDRYINIQMVAESDQLDSNSNSRMKHVIARENIDRNNGCKMSPLATGVLNEDIKSMNKQQTCTELQNTASDNSISDTAENADKENDLSLKRKPSSATACHNQRQQKPGENNYSTQSAKKPTYDAVALPNTERGTVC